MVLTDFTLTDPTMDYAPNVILDGNSGLYRSWTGSVYATDLGTWRTVNTHLLWNKIIVLGTACADIVD